MAESPTGGVKPMNIAGRMVYERQRLAGMTDAERAWRAQWLKDQVLAPDEPRVPENYYKKAYNPLRRFYRAPLDYFEKVITPYTGTTAAQMIRLAIGRGALAYIGLLYVVYYFKYNKNDWTRNGGWRVSSARQAMFIGDPDWPNFKEKTKGTDYVTFGFENSPI